jgi:choline dehydrogenase-like flavoprotein
MVSAAEAQDTSWDVIIVGTGVGGGTLGYQLAKAGQKVLFCESGRVSSDHETAIRGSYLETALWHGWAVADALKDLLYARAGRASRPMELGNQPRGGCFVPFIGQALGGSSALYGMVLERFFPADFTPGITHGPAANDSLLPSEWPVSYEAFEPWYERAERLYEVKGQIDPLKKDIIRHNGIDDVQEMFHPANRRLADSLAAKGLHPYRLPLAQREVQECQGCQGYLCERRCKVDSWTACVQPALEMHGAGLITGCEVAEILTEGARAVGVRAHQGGEVLTIRGRMVVLAAGALQTPVLLLRSAGGRGIGNAAGLVGAGLMRHAIDVYAIPLQAGEEAAGNSKEIGWNDFYHEDQLKLGTVQSFGTFPPISVVLAELLEGRDRLLGGLARWFPGLADKSGGLWRRTAGRRLFLASVLEDLPYARNRVTLSSSGTARLSYRLGDYETRRAARLRAQVQAALRPLKATCLKQADDNRRIAHACGSCRFGTDPGHSVLDPYNRVHDMDNLFVVDASFLPSSGGTNPSLTIAANALRVGDYILNGAKGMGKI